MKKFTATSHDGDTITLQATCEANAAHLAGVHWYPNHTTSAGNPRGGTWCIRDRATGETLCDVTITPYAPAQSGRHTAGVIFPVRSRMVTLDEPTVTTLRALGDGNLSLGVRRAAALIGGGA